MGTNPNWKIRVVSDGPTEEIKEELSRIAGYYENDEEYYVQFTAETIENIHSKFMQDLSNRNVFNLEHDTDKTVPAYVLEAWIVEDPKKDKAYSSYGIEVPKGTLMVTAQVTDKEYYNELVKNEQIGFSIEGFLGLKLSNQLNNKYSMNKSESIKNIASALVKFQASVSKVAKESNNPFFKKKYASLANILDTIQKGMIQPAALPAVRKAMDEGVLTVSSGFDKDKGVGFAVGKAKDGRVVRIEEKPPTLDFIVYLPI